MSEERKGWWWVGIHTDSTPMHKLITTRPQQAGRQLNSNQSAKCSLLRVRAWPLNWTSAAPYTPIYEKWWSWGLLTAARFLPLPSWLSHLYRGPGSAHGKGSIIGGQQGHHGHCWLVPSRSRALGPSLTARPPDWWIPPHQRCRHKSMGFGWSPWQGTKQVSGPARMQLPSFGSGKTTRPRSAWAIIWRRTQSTGMHASTFLALCKMRVLLLHSWKRNVVIRILFLWQKCPVILPFLYSD